jgi:hypothetical protein
VTELLENPVQPPPLGENRLGQLRAHLLDEIERDSAKRERRARLRSCATSRRVVLIVAVVVLAVIYSVPAVAEERWWWMGAQGSSLQPVTQVQTLGEWTTEQLRLQPERGPVPTTGFGAAGQRWTMQAFMSAQSGLCVGISPDPPRPANEGAFLSCGHPVRGIPLTHTPSELHWVGWGTAIPGKVTDSAPRLLFGPAAPDVRTVDLENNNNGRVLRVQTHPLPDSLGFRARFWIVVLSAEQLVHTIVPRDEDGKALEHWRLPIAQ